MHDVARIRNSSHRVETSILQRRGFVEVRQEIACSRAIVKSGCTCHLLTHMVLYATVFVDSETNRDGRELAGVPGTGNHVRDIF